MKQTLSLAVLGAVYALAAVVDAPLVFQAFALCGNSLVPYEGMGWFAGGSAALAALLLGLAFSRVVWSIPPQNPLRQGIESFAIPAGVEPGMIVPVPAETFPSLHEPFDVPLIDVASE